MTTPLSNLRYEKKFIADGFSLAEVLSRVRQHPAAFREVYPPRVVNNIYLDSPTLRNYLDHINGVGNRSKTRMRWYGTQCDMIERPMLEQKHKRGMVSGKEAFPLPPLSISSSNLGRQMDLALKTASLTDWKRAELRFMEPVLFNRYKRQYFLSRDGKFRLTVDFHLQFSSVLFQCGPSAGLSTPAMTLIVELKFGPEVAEDTCRITNALPFRLSRFSKYVAGMERI
jgi:hypothetical protein